MYKKTLFSFLFLFICFTINAQSIKGKWKVIADGSERSIIWIYEAKNGKYYGKITKVLAKDAKETCENCSGDRKGKPLKGLVILKALEKNGKVWQNGKILDPNTGKEYSCKVWIANGKLKMRGYWGIFYKTQTWTKVN